ncbi:TMV resistance protein N-like [Capsicum annuum]|uniref:TMV resistance protein N-like n=1 Tax=Capsicum annuum TaxID=4072 RepID=UPI001FB18165|nr:TMV resistance protein N-like [Capsicum annuum]
MHDLIEDMGRYVVKMQKDLGEYSRIWDVEDFEEVMLNNTESKAIESIWLQHDIFDTSTRNIVKKLYFSKEVMKNMTRLKLLYINKFDTHEHLPRSIAQLGALRCLDLSHCKRLTQLPEFPVQLDTIEADWTNYWICNSLFRNLSLLQHDISASDSLSLRVIRGWRWHGMPRFPYQGIDGVSVYLPENWYIHDSFSGFAVCYHGILTDITAHLIPLNDDGVSCITRKLVLSNHSKYSLERNGIHFFLIPFAGLWDISKANGKTPNDYRHIMLSSSEKIKYIFRLLYKMN